MSLSSLTIYPNAINNAKLSMYAVTANKFTKKIVHFLRKTLNRENLKKPAHIKRFKVSSRSV